VKANAAQIRAQLDAPGGDFRLFLLHGPDESGAIELAQRLARALGPDAERIDIEGSSLRSNPGRLADEAASLSLFGGKRLIRVTGAEDDSIEAFTLLLAAERTGNPVVAIGPSLKATGKLVKLALAAPAAMAHACYVPEGGDATRLAATVAREHGLRLLGETAERLAAASGGDRAVLSREIEKLALYLDAAPERPKEATLADLDAIGADLGEAELFRSIETVIDGRADEIGRELARLQQAGISPIPLLRQMVRRLMAIADMRAEVDGGSGPGEVVERYRVFFREKARTIRALERWRSPQIVRAISLLRETERAIMRSGTAGDVLAEAACATVARGASRM
jgi:DNA polymerase-3 subunit delta